MSPREKKSRLLVQEIVKIILSLEEANSLNVAIHVSEMSS